MRSTAFDVTAGPDAAQEALLVLLGGPEEVHRDHLGRFVPQEAPRVPGTGESGEQVDQPATDFDSGVRETLPEAEDPVAAHHTLLLELVAGRRANTSGRWS